MTAAIYARVSTVDQTAQQQLGRLRPLAPGATEYVDDGMTGRNTDRPGFIAMRAAVEAGLLREVYAVKLDRLGRSVIDVLGFFDLCEKHHVRVVVADQGFDTSTPSGRLVRTILAAIAEFESELIRDRTQAAMDAIKAGTRRTRSGRPPGRPIRMTPEMAERIRHLRLNPKPDGSYRTWKEIAITVHMPAGSCSKVPHDHSILNPMHGGRPGTTPFHCPTCNRYFQRAQDLRSHSVVHTWPMHGSAGNPSSEIGKGAPFSPGVGDAAPSAKEKASPSPDPTAEPPRKETSG